MDRRFDASEWRKKCHPITLSVIPAFISAYPKSGLRFDRDYLGIHLTDDCIFFQITLNDGRSVQLKQKFYMALADRLHERVKLRKEDVLINLVEVPKENWSFGNGIAQYASR
jgi:4-oxalocrotonate tautomerase